jgi:very-short-patch-repair endonuclease
VVRNITEIAERQHGVVTLEQALASGLTPDQIQRRLSTGRWEGMGRGVYRLAGSRRTWEQRLLALTLAAGPAAAASHRSAAALLAIPGFERRAPIEVTTPRVSRHRADGEIVHRWRPFPHHHLTVIEGIVTTRVARTLCDLAGVLHPGKTERAIDNCLAMGIATPGTLQAAFSDLASRGRKGTAVLRLLLADRSAGYIPPASETEARFRDLVREAGLPEPVRQLDVGDDEAWIGRVDVAYPPARLLIELDSRRHHSSKLDVEADAARDRRLTRTGWRVVRFTWTDLVERPGWVVSELRRLLESAAA